MKNTITGFESFGMVAVEWQIIIKNLGIIFDDNDVGITLLTLLLMGFRFILLWDVSFLAWNLLLMIRKLVFLSIQYKIYVNNHKQVYINQYTGFLKLIKKANLECVF